MTLIKLIAFLGIIIGSFVLLELSPFEFLEDISGKFKGKKKSIKSKVKQAVSRKKPKGITLIIQSTLYSIIFLICNGCNHSCINE